MPGLIAVPFTVLTVIIPDVAPGGTKTEFELSEFVRKAALTPLNLTEVVSVELKPLSVTTAPDCPNLGEKSLIAGAAGFGATVKLLELRAIPFDVVTSIGPVRAPAG